MAGICEFLGAVLLGANVADTIKSGIAKLPAFNGTPGMLLCCWLLPDLRQVSHRPDMKLCADLMMVGMMVVLLTTGLWLALATFLELPVSTSHSVGQNLFPSNLLNTSAVLSACTSLIVSHLGTFSFSPMRMQLELLTSCGC